MRLHKEYFTLYFHFITLKQTEQMVYTSKMTVVITTKGAYLVANETVEMPIHPPNSDL